MAKKEIIMWVAAGIIAAVVGVTVGLSTTDSNNVTKKNDKKELTVTQSLALDLLKEFEEDMNGKYKEEGIEMSVVYNGKEYTRASDFENDIK